MLQQRRFQAKLNPLQYVLRQLSILSGDLGIGTVLELLVVKEVDKNPTGRVGMWETWGLLAYTEDSLLSAHRDKAGALSLCFV